jgi:hypothetical protein
MAFSHQSDLPTFFSTLKVILKIPNNSGLQVRIARPRKMGTSEDILPVKQIYEMEEKPFTSS